ncbi:MAG TPA: Retaining alpha-galactosidase [Prolixibacteraceae bacterium]|jgi:alpha-glucosidase|nr:Retaining alpha-galactosidase [Prolixibacteraceae bacterium]
MRTSLLGIFIVLLVSSTLFGAQKGKNFEIKSPDNKISVHLEIGDKMLWSVQHEGQQIIAPSALSMQLEGGEVLGDHAKVTGSIAEKADQVISAFNYKKKNIADQYNQLTVHCKGDYSVVFRAYNDGVAYRFVSTKNTDIIVKNEEANFNFTADHKAFIPYMWDYRAGQKFNHSFEALYKEINLSNFASDSMAFLPLLVDLGSNKKVVILEADLEDYPGMYLNINSTKKGLMGVYAPYPLEARVEGSNLIPTRRADYIAKCAGSRNFPWRAIVISTQDKDLLNNDMVQKLAAPSRISDTSWIKPGLASWDWWSNWNISHVDFRAGYNTPTYKYYIDFAAANKLPYVVMDAGWSNGNDILKVTADVDIQELTNYARQKGVDIILWALWNTVTEQMDQAFPKYSKMGVKGFKIDFVDRDDQVAVASLYEIARKAADYHLLVDYHGAFKPTGLQRTYPNVIGFEGVKGLENYKWATEDQPRYTVSIPFIRMMAGPMDYTPGAMRNTNKTNYRPVGAMPFSQGTRCNQMAMFVVYEAPFQMMADNPTTYMKEQECTDFIARIPTTTDETFALDGKVGEYAALARKKGETWFVGAMSNWTPREMTLDLSFLGTGSYQATVFKDGINADCDATDYKKEVMNVSSADKVKVQLAPGGGWVARIEKLK